MEVIHEANLFKEITKKGDNYIKHEVHEEENSQKPALIFIPGSA